MGLIKNILYNIYMENNYINTNLNSLSGNVKIKKKGGCGFYLLIFIILSVLNGIYILYSSNACHSGEECFGSGLFSAILIGSSILLMLLIIIFGEIFLFFINKKNIQSNTTAQSNTYNNIGLASKIFSFLFFLSSIYFLFHQIYLFVLNFKYIKFLKDVNSLGDYGLKDLSVLSIFTTIPMLMIYILFLMSFFSIYKIFKKSDSYKIFLSISLLFFVILFTNRIFYSNYPMIYSGTFYQDNGYYKGGIFKANIKDLLESDKAIKMRNINLCEGIGYVYYKNYCINKITEENNK